MLNNCDQQTLLVLLCFVLVVVFMDSIDKVVPKLRNLFNNQVNLCLVALVVIFTMLLNVPVGAMLLFVTLYIQMYYRNKQTMVMREAFQNNHLHKQVLDLVADEDPTFNHGANADSHIEPDQNKVEIARAVNDLPKNPELTKSVKTVTRGPKKCDQGNDLLTQTFDKNRNGFDVVGCRYDMKASPQNLTMNGPPVAQCGNYHKDKMDIIGTAFYPLNH
jgi:hypothetical protein